MKLWRQYHLTYDQTHDVAKDVRRAPAIERPKTRTRVVARRPREEERQRRAHAYRLRGTRGLLIKTLFQTGAWVSELMNITADEVFVEAQMLLIANATGGRSRSVPILPQLAQELRTHLGQQRGALRTRQWAGGDPRLWSCTARTTPWRGQAHEPHRWAVTAAPGPRHDRPWRAATPPMEQGSSPGRWA
jgi:integrase